jgi:Universal stress protein UspA and related nucleotide-binding proteins
MTSISPTTLWEPSRLLAPLNAEEDAATEYLEGQRLLLAKRGIDASTYVDVGRPASRIVKFAADQGADLIAMTTHGRSGLARFWLGSIATGVLHQSHLPLLLVRSTEDPGAESASPIRRIYVPDDGSEPAAAARPFIGDFAGALGASIVFHRVIELFSPIVLPSLQAVGGYDSLLEAVKSAAVDELAEEAGSLERAGVETQVMVTKGSVPDELLRAANEVDASLIALSTHGLSGAGRIVLGSAADAVVRRTELPCLLIRPLAIRQQMQGSSSS